MTLDAVTAPNWADLSEHTVATIDGRERTVIDHYGTIARVPFPGSPTRRSSLPTFDIDVSRCDVVDEADSSKVQLGPYLVTATVSEQYADSRLNSLDDLEKFALALLTAAQSARALFAKDARGTTKEVA
ncbi:hypothetical protein ACIPJ2_16170 [Curtobacterium sp. NPDC090217]|uniref:hypothetical protein n=1 Tax=Curtobacterium sp. NPDC090217 TaxID=3363970 RepID=UPI00382C15B6